MRQSLSNRIDEIVKLRDEIRVLESCLDIESLCFTCSQLGVAATTLMGYGVTYGDARQCMIETREQRLADNVKEPGVRSGKYAQPLDPVYEATPLSAWWERYPAIERFRAYTANEEPRIPATLEEGHVE